MSEEIKARIKYHGNIKRFHRYRVVDSEGDIVGKVYLSKEFNLLPKKVVLERST